MKRNCLGVLAWLCCTQLFAQSQAGQAAPDTATAYQQIEAERARETAQFTAQETDCYQRFAVNDCLKQLQSRHIAVLADLKRRETLLHSAERARQGSEQLERSKQKAQERQQSASQAEEGAARAREKLQAQHEKQSAHAAQRDAASALSPVAPTPTGVTPAEQAANREHYAAKQAAAEKKRQQVAKRLKEKQNDKPVSALPTPH